jgi:hypothetical protein
MRTECDTPALRLARQIPMSGQAYRTARDEALADFAEQLVQAGLIREGFHNGTLVLELADVTELKREGGENE